MKSKQQQQQQQASLDRRDLKVCNEFEFLVVCSSEFQNVQTAAAKARSLKVQCWVSVSQQKRDNGGDSVVGRGQRGKDGPDNGGTCR